ncbi:MAG: zinc ribbon domain-containing protein [Bacteroidota bacterium]|nr:zinc ribbon domain-containing protein [Bacteroidota bacterium]
MSYCTKCGKQNPDTAKFCTGCGITLKPVVTQSIPTAVPINVNHPLKTESPSKNKTKWLLIGIIVFLGLGAGIYFIFFNKKKDIDKATVTTDNVVPAADSAVRTNTTTTEVTPPVSEAVPSNTETLTARIPQIIKDFYQMAETRNFDNLYDSYLTGIERYYGKTYPSRVELQTLFSNYYSANSNSFHDITNIQTTPYTDYTEAIVTLNYSYFVIKTQEQKYQSDIKVRFIFNKNGQIKSISAL